MALSSRWEGQYVAVTDGNGKPAAHRLAKARCLPLWIAGAAALDQRALHAERVAWNAPIARRRCGYEATFGEGAEGEGGCRGAKRATEAFVAMLVATEGGADGCIGGMLWMPGIATIDSEAREEGDGERVEQMFEP